MPIKRKRAPELEKIHAQIKRRHAKFESGAASSDDLAQEAIAQVLARKPSAPAAYAHQVAANAAKPVRRSRSILNFNEESHGSVEEALIEKEKHVLLMVAMEHFIVWGNQESTGVQIEDLHSFDHTEVLKELRFYQTVVESLPYSARHIRRMTVGLKAALRTALERSSYELWKRPTRGSEDGRPPQASEFPADTEQESPWDFTLDDDDLETVGERAEDSDHASTPDSAASNPFDDPGFDKWFMCQRGATLIRRLGPSIGEAEMWAIAAASYQAVYEATQDAPDPHETGTDEDE